MSASSAGSSTSRPSSRTDVFDAIVEAGDAFGLRLAGYHALNSLRMEKGYRHWGHDITDEDNPLEAGLGFAVAWDKPGGFIGREALAAPARDAGAHTPPGPASPLDDPEPLLYHNEPIWRDGMHRRARSPPACSATPSASRSAWATSPIETGPPTLTTSTPARTRSKSPDNASQPRVPPTVLRPEEHPGEELTDGLPPAPHCQ